MPFVAPSTEPVTLYDVNRYYDACGIVGELECRMGLFTNWLLAERNVCLSGPSSTAKTSITQATADLVDSVFTISSGSDKVSWYLEKQLDECKFVVIPEINEVPRDFIDLILKKWGEDKDAQRRVTTTDYGGRRSAQTFTLKPKPFVFDLADENPLKIGVELRTRITDIRTDGSEDMNRRVVRQIGLSAKSLKSTEEDASVLKFRIMRQLKAMPAMESLLFRHPAADVFVDIMPPKNAGIRRDFKIKYLPNTYGIARFFHDERIKFAHPAKKGLMVLLVTPQDMWLNQFIYGRTLIDSAMNLNAVQREIISILVSLGEAGATSAQVQLTLQRRGIMVSNTMLRKHLGSLYDETYVTKVKDPVAREDIYCATELFDKFKLEVDWPRVLKECRKTVKEEYPEQASEYISRFLTNPQVQNPFTGEIVNLADEAKERVLVQQRTLGQAISSGVREIRVGAPLPEPVSGEEDGTLIDVPAQYRREDDDLMSDDLIRGFVDAKGLYPKDEFIAKFGEETYLRMGSSKMIAVTDGMVAARYEKEPAAYAE